MFLLRHFIVLSCDLVAIHPTEAGNHRNLIPTFWQHLKSQPPASRAHYPEGQGLSSHSHQATAAFHPPCLLGSPLDSTSDTLFYHQDHQSCFEPLPAWLGTDDHTYLCTPRIPLLDISSSYQDGSNVHVHVHCALWTSFFELQRSRGPGSDGNPGSPALRPWSLGFSPLTFPLYNGSVNETPECPIPSITPLIPISSQTHAKSGHKNLLMFPYCCSRKIRTSSSKVLRERRNFWNRGRKRKGE